MSAPGEFTTATNVPVTSAHESPRIAEAREHAAQRVRRQRDTLRPMGWAVVLVVIAGAIGGQPHPAIQGKGLGVTLALLAFAGALAIAIRGGFTEGGYVMQTAVISLMGAAGVALVALQPQGATELGGGAAMWMAVVRLPLTIGIPVGVVIGVALDAAAALSGTSSVGLFAATLLLVLIGFVGYFMKQSRASQDRTELLLAQLEDAREEQTRAAAIAERGRIAGELHDVLAHSLSGAAIQLQAARKLAERENATPTLHAAIDRAGALVKDGLANARQAVGALRGDELPGVSQLDSLVQSFRDDMQATVNLSIEGGARTLPPDAGLASVPRSAGGSHECRPLRAWRSGRHRSSLRTRSHDAARRGSEHSRDRLPSRRRLARGRRWTRTCWSPRACRASWRQPARRPHRRRMACRSDRPRMTESPIRVLIADDQRVVRDGLTMLVGLIDGVEVVGVAGDGIEAVERAESERPDVVLMDLRMPTMEGAEATRRIRAALPETQVLVLTTYADDQSLFPALQAGARGYLTKDASAEEIEQAIRALAAGRTHLDPAIQQRLVAAVLETQPRTARRRGRSQTT